MFQRLRRSHVAVALSVAFLCLAAEASPPPFEKVCPDSTLVYVSVKNIPAAVAKLRKSGLLGALDEPEFRGFIEKPAAALGEFLEGQVGMTLVQFGDIFQGQIAIAAMGMEEQEEGPPVPQAVLLVDTGANGPNLMTYSTME